jgi:hypothetical protein
MFRVYTELALSVFAATNKCRLSPLFAFAATTVLPVPAFFTMRENQSFEAMPIFACNAPGGGRGDIGVRGE